VCWRNDGTAGTPVIPAEADTTDIVPGGTADEGSTDAPAADDTTGSTTTDGEPLSVDIGNNPGTVPSPVLGVVSSLSIEDIAGYKVYAGPDNILAAGNLGVLFSNYQFNCDGTGNFENFPSPEFAFIIPPASGTTTWQVDGDQLVVDVVTSSDSSLVGDDVLFDDVLNNGTVLVGETSLDTVIVTNIFQVEECL